MKMARINLTLFLPLLLMDTSTSCTEHQQKPSKFEFRNDLREILSLCFESHTFAHLIRPQLRLRPSSERPSRLDRALRGAWRRISPSRGTSLSKNDDRDERHLPVDVQDTKDALGLNLLHDPPNPKIDFIFVHGLGGGSRKTWASSADPEQYWPAAWLPQDPEFSSVRIHSFGYNADWNEWRTNTLNILDFARSLLGEISCNTKIRRSDVSDMFPEMLTTN
jgi:hypothetical protein